MYPFYQCVLIIQDSAIVEVCSIHDITLQYVMYWGCLSNSICECEGFCSCHMQKMEPLQALDYHLYVLVRIYH